MSILGTSDDGRDVKLNYRKRTRGLYCIGTNGTGKTTFLVNLALQDIENGHGLCYLDPHGDAIKDILKRIPDWRVDDVIYVSLDSKPPYGLDLHPSFGLNLFDCPDPTNDKQVALTSSFVTHVFEKVWGAGLEGSFVTQYARIAQFLRNISITMISNPGMTFAEVPLLLQNKLVRDTLVANVKNEQVRLFWKNYDKLREYDQQERSAPIYNRVEAFLTLPVIRNIVGQSKTTIYFDHVINEGKILLVELSPRYEDITSLLGAMIIGKLLDAAFARSESQQRKYFSLFVDEFHRYATSDMETLLTEARKFNIGTVIAHQVRDQLEPKMRAAALNVGNLVIFKTTGKDGEELAAEFDCTPPPPEVIGQRPILSPKREVIEHLLQNGHSDPKFLEGVKFLIALQEVVGMKVERPPFRQISNFDERMPENLIVLFQQHRAAAKYEQATEAQTDLRITIQRLNNFFYGVMQSRDPNKELNEEDLITLLKAFQVFKGIKETLRYEPLTLMWLCSPDNAKMHKGLSTISCVPAMTGDRLVLGMRVKPIVTGLRSLVNLLAENPIMVNSGQHEPIYDKPRTYADVQNQIATELVNLPKFTAKVRLEQEEYIMKTRPFGSGVDESTFKKRSFSILLNNYSYGWLRESAEVAEEIRKRQEDLQNPPEEPPPPQRQNIVDIEI